MARKRQIDAIVVAYKDRLTRFGFTYLEELFKAYGVKVIVAFMLGGSLFRRHHLLV